MKRYKLVHGDCLSVMKKIPNNSIDLILTDPPYGTTACVWDSVIDLTAMWENISRIIKQNCGIILFANQPYTSVLVCSNLHWYKHSWVWEKSRSGSAISAKHCPVKIHEDILVFSKNGKTLGYFPQMEVGDPYSRKSKYSNDNNHKFGIAKNVETNNFGTRFPKTIRFEKQNWSKQQQVHPTQKPVELMEYFIKTYSKEGQVILDFTMGSGTTGVACMNTNRRFFGIEKESKYYDIACRRIEEASKPKRKLFSK